MSDKPINVGDLVICIRGRKCGCPSVSDGVVFKVTQIAPVGGPYSGCNHPGFGGFLAISGDRVHRVELCRLKRIPPLDELESEKRDEEITA